MCTLHCAVSASLAWLGWAAQSVTQRGEVSRASNSRRHFDSRQQQTYNCHCWLAKGLSDICFSVGIVSFKRQIDAKVKNTPQLLSWCLLQKQTINKLLNSIDRNGWRFSIIMQKDAL